MKEFQSRLLRSIFALSLLTWGTTLPTHAGDPHDPIDPKAVIPTDDETVFRLALYSWAADTTAVTAAGRTATLDFADALDSLEMAFMARPSLKWNRWEFAADILYQDLGLGVLGGNVDLESWIVTPTVGYDLICDAHTTVNFFAGARFLDQEVDARIPTATGLATISTVDQYWSGIVGIKGEHNISERLFLSWHADVGAGEPDLNWQVFGGFGYRFSRCDLIVGYRHLEWEFATGESLTDLQTSGPLLGLRFSF